MTSATSPVLPAGPQSLADRRELQPTIRASLPSGWYDPDGAAWEAETISVADTVPVQARPSIVLDPDRPTEY